MRTIFSLLLGCLFFGCSSEEIAGPVPNESRFLPAPAGEPRLVIEVVDESGEPIRPDFAWWYYPPDEQGRANEYEARCVNDACTRWAVTGARNGRVYVAAQYSRKHRDPYCSYGAFDARPVDIGAAVLPTVTLRLEEAEMCQ